MTLLNRVKRFTATAVATAVFSGIVPVPSLQKPDLTSLLKPANASTVEIVSQTPMQSLAGHPNTFEEKESEGVSSYQNLRVELTDDGRIMFADKNNVSLENPWIDLTPFFEFNPDYTPKGISVINGDSGDFKDLDIILYLKSNNPIFEKNYLAQCRFDGKKLSEISRIALNDFDSSRFGGFVNNNIADISALTLNNEFYLGILENDGKTFDIYKLDGSLDSPSAGAPADLSGLVETPITGFDIELLNGQLIFKSSSDAALYSGDFEGNTDSGLLNKKPYLEDREFFLDASHGNAALYSVMPIDPDGDDVYAEMTGGNVSLDGSILSVPLTAGSYYAKFNIWDDRMTPEQGTESIWRFYVTDPTVPNEPPVIDGASNLSGPENQVTSGQINTNDPNGDIVQCSLEDFANLSSVSVNQDCSYNVNPGDAAHPDTSKTGSFTVKAVDGKDGETYKTFTFIGLDNNIVPAGGNLSVSQSLENQYTSGTIQTIDPDGDQVSCQLTESTGLEDVIVNPNCSFQVNPGNVAHPDTTKLGSFTVKFVDGYGGESTKAYSFTGLDNNINPAASGPDSVSVDENSTKTVYVTFDDADGDALGIDTLLPAFAAYSALTGALELNPGFSDAGSYQATITADDGYGGIAKKVVGISVNNVNRGPSYNGPFTISSTENTPKSGTLNASDPDGDILTYRLVSGPSWFDVNSNSTYSDNAGYDEIQHPTGWNGETLSDTYDAVIEVKDPYGATDIGNVVITLNDKDRKGSYLTSGLNSSFNEGDDMNAWVTYTDPDGDSFYFDDMSDQTSPNGTMISTSQINRAGVGGYIDGDASGTYSNTFSAGPPNNKVTLQWDYEVRDAEPPFE